MPPESRVHYAYRPDVFPLCGNSGPRTQDTRGVTCKTCQRKLLEDFAPWARDHLAGRGKPLEPVTIFVPAGSPEPVDGKVKGLGDGFGRAFRQKRDPQEAIGVLLSMLAAVRAPVQPIMDDGGPAADAGGIEKGKVPEQSGDAG